MKRTKLIAAVLLALTTMGAAPAPMDYVARLLALRGQSYFTLDCQKYIVAAKLHRDCGRAKGMFNGCDGDMEVIAEVPTLDDVNVASLQPGDVLAFNQKHVAAYVGHGQFMDSDTRHNGVGTMQPIKGDAWFSGPVRIVRWKK
jgi:hypothetical protein